MMKLVGIVLVLSVILFTRAAGFAQQAAQPSGDETKILALENAWNRALELHDVQGIAGLVDDTLANIRPSGVLENKTQYLARVKGSPGEKVEQAVNGDRYYLGRRIAGDATGRIAIGDRGGS